MKYDPNATGGGGTVPPGIYGFEVLEAKETTSRKGNPMLALTLLFNDGRVWDYILADNGKRIAQFCACVGVDATGEVEPRDLIGREGRARLSIEESPGYPAKNKVEAYLPTTVPQPAEASPTGPTDGPAPDAGAPGVAAEDNLPF